VLVSDAPEITVLQTPRFKTEATELIGTDGIEAVADYLIEHPEAGAVIAGGRRAEIALGGEGEGKARLRADYLSARCGGCTRIPDSLLRQERPDGFDG